MAVIFYLSGSGNTLYAAQRAAQAWPGCRLESMGGYLRHPYNIEDERVGIFYPTYCFDAPPLVMQFLEKLQAQPRYCALITTMGGKEGLALYSCQQELLKKKLKVAYAQAIVMPDNFFKIPHTLREKLLTRSELLLTKLVTALQEERLDVEAINSTSFFKRKVTQISWWGLEHVVKLQQLQVDSERCIGCGLCEQICSVKNIHLEQGKPVFGNNCAHCLGCVHWCPQSAIRAGRIRVNEQSRYVHPRIKPSMFD